MVEATFKTGNQSEARKTTGTLDQYGIHTSVTTDFYDRRQNILTELQDFITDEEIDGRTDWTPRRKTMAKMAQKKLRLVFYHGASGKGAENGKFYKAMGACRNITTRVMESLECDASDDDLWLNNMDRLATMDKIIMATFGTDNTTVMTSFVVQSPMMNQMQQPTMMPVQQLGANSEKPTRGGGEYAGRSAQG